MENPKGSTRISLLPVTAHNRATFPVFGGICGETRTMNTGNVARLCAVTGSKLILVEPLGFSIADRDLKRAGLDYWDKVFVSLHKSYVDYLAAYPNVFRVLFSARAEKSLYDVS